MPKITSASQRRARARGSSQPYAKPSPSSLPLPVLPDPHRPDLTGLKPQEHKKMLRKKAFLESIGQSAAAAAVDVGQRKGGGDKKGGGAGGKEGGDGLTPSWGDVRLMLDSLPSNSLSGGGGASGGQMKIKSNSSKKMIASKEIERLKAVTTHPVFKQNPHQAIREHLANTLAAANAAAAAAAAAEGGKGEEKTAQTKTKLKVKAPGAGRAGVKNGAAKKKPLPAGSGKGGKKRR